MRIISGKYRGHQLVGFKGSHIRPTTDRVKESVFNILAPEVDGARILDLFSGTGNLMIEALSRGAASVDAVEQHPGSLKVIRANLEKLKIEHGFKIVASDVFKFLKKYNDAPYDIIFVDPPFTEKWADRVLTELSLSKVFGPHTIIMIEAASKEKVGETYNSLKKYKERHFGDKIVFFFSSGRDSQDTSESGGPDGGKEQEGSENGGGGISG